MASEGPGRAGAPSLTSLPRIEDIPQAGDGLDAERVREAFDAFRRHAAQLQAQLRVLQVAGTRPGAGAAVEATGHAVRMDALHMIRAAAEFADTIERDAQNASATQLGRTEEEVSRRQRELQEREAEIERYRQESERQRADMLNTARNESRELLAKAHARRDARAPGGRGEGQPAARAVPPPGDGAHERRPRRGRADARVGARAGVRRSSPAPSTAPSSCSPPPASGEDAISQVADGDRHGRRAGGRGRTARAAGRCARRRSACNSSGNSARGGAAADVLRTADVDLGSSDVSSGARRRACRAAVQPAAGREHGAGGGGGRGARRARELGRRDAARLRPKNHRRGRVPRCGAGHRARRRAERVRHRRGERRRVSARARRRGDHLARGLDQAGPGKAGGTARCGACVRCARARRRSGAARAGGARACSRAAARGAAAHRAGSRRASAARAGTRTGAGTRTRARPALAVVPELAPEPEPEPEPALAEAPAVAQVVPIGVGAAPRQWNVWELERLAREDSGSDAVRDEERTFLLMYLREYADAGGVAAGRLRRPRPRQLRRSRRPVTTSRPGRGPGDRRGGRDGRRGRSPSSCGRTTTRAPAPRAAPGTSPSPRRTRRRPGRRRAPAASPSARTPSGSRILVCRAA